MKYILILIAFMACGYGQYPNTIYNGNDYTQFDSSKYYYKKQAYWQKKYDNEFERVNKFKNADITQALLDYQDSCIKFKLLLSNYKK